MIMPFALLFILRCFWHGSNFRASSGQFRIPLPSDRTIDKLKKYDFLLKTWISGSSNTFDIQSSLNSSLKTSLGGNSKWKVRVLKKDTTAVLKIPT
jgi:hypothetical protein